MTGRTVWVVGTPYAADEIHGVALSRAGADQVADAARDGDGDLSVEVLTYGAEPAGDELARALLERLGADRLRLVGPYLEKRAIDARATSRVDQAKALTALGEAIAEAVARAEAERRDVLDDEAYEPDPDEGRDLDDEG